MVQMAFDFLILYFVVQVCRGAAKVGRQRSETEAASQPASDSSAIGPADQVNRPRRRPVHTHHDERSADVTGHGDTPIRPLLIRVCANRSDLLR